VQASGAPCLGHQDERHRRGGVHRLRRPGGVAHLLDVAVVGRDKQRAAGGKGRVDHPREAGVDHLGRPHRRRPHPGVTHHVRVGEIHHDEVVLPCRDRLHDLVGDRLCGHLRRQIIGGNVPARWDENPVLTGQWLLDPAVDIANGFDARYLYSFGPFQLAPAETASVSIAVLAGTSFHNDPANFASNLFNSPGSFRDTAKIRAYQNGLDFSDLITKVIAARQKLGIVPVRGDINGDGLLSAADVVALLNIIFQSNPPPTPALHDLNCDGNISAADLVLLLNVVFMGSPLPC